MINKLGFSGSISGKVSVDNPIDRIKIEELTSEKDLNAVIARPGDIIKSPENGCMIVTERTDKKTIVHDFGDQEHPKKVLTNNDLADCKRIAMLDVIA